ncbi:MAG: hypothetical protein WCK02_07315 [Bacteroidota bacterium]
MKPIKIIIISITLFLSIGNMNAQNCQLIKSALHYQIKDTTFGKVLLVNEFDRFYIGDIDWFRLKLSKYVKDSSKLDSIVRIIRETNLVKEKLESCDDLNATCISEQKRQRILSKNNKHEEEVRFTSKYAVFTFSFPIFIENYAIIQCSHTLKSLNGLCNTYLFKFIQNKWIYVDVLYTAAS